MPKKTLHNSPALNIFDIGYVSPDMRLVLKLRDLIDKHYADNKPRAFYCHVLGVSLAKINDLTKEYFDRTLFRLIQDRLLAEARKLLQEGDLSVKEVCFKLGFVDQAYFGRVVKKATGYTPMELKEEGREITFDEKDTIADVDVA